MTDNDIVKALECCITTGASCKDCPAFVKVDRSNCKKYFRSAIDLINRLQAENERLKDEYEETKKRNKDLEYAFQSYKAEAYKEFAERLKECAFTVNQFEEVLYKEDIDDLLKELVGEDNGKG